VDTLAKAWAAASPNAHIGLSPMAADLRVMAKYLIPEAAWEADGEQTVVRRGSLSFRVLAQGFPRPFEILVLIQREGERSTLWYRRLYRGDDHAITWLESALPEGYREFLNRVGSEVSPSGV
jgi:hypothetical protein